MKTYKIRATMTIEVEQEIYANSEDDARSKFIAQSIRDTVEDSTSLVEVDTTIDDVEMFEGTFVVKVTKVDYDVDFDTCYDIILDDNPYIDEDSIDIDRIVKAKMAEIKKELPQELTLEITCEKPDLDDYILDAIAEETNWLVNSYEYEIVEVK